MAEPKLRVVKGEGESRLAAPDHLGEYGRAFWEKTVAELHSLGIADQVNLSLVEYAAEMYEGRREAQHAVKKHGHLIKGRTGMKKNPAVSKQIEYGREFRQTMKELDRQKEHAHPSVPSEDDPFDF